MDGFDDLLDTSKSHPILDNPFEDPFARPRSPDPWLTFQQQPGRHEEHTPVTEQPREHSTSVPQPSKSSALTSQPSYTEAADPLDAKAANEEDQAAEAPRASQRQPSEVVSSSHTLPIISPMPRTPPELVAVPAPDPEPELALPSPSLRDDSPAPSQSPKSPAKQISPSPRSSAPNSSATLLVSKPPASETKSQTPMSSPQAGGQSKPTPSRIPVVSPLDGGSTNGQSSFATLALGGEMPGWQGSLSQNIFVNQVHGQDDGSSATGWSEHGNGESFINGTPRREDSDDDDDDDLPIAVRLLTLLCQST